MVQVLRREKGRWDERFPTARPGDEPTRGILKEPSQGPCQACGTVTSWRYLGSYDWVCSGACLRQLLGTFQRRSRDRLRNVIERVKQTTTGSIVGA